MSDLTVDWVSEDGYGRVLRTSEGEWWQVQIVGSAETIHNDSIEYLREYFLAERDHDLGRWRDPENPDYVVYEKKADASVGEPGVRVVHEVTGRSRDVDRRVIENLGSSTRFDEVAYNYFAAHPKPKPWHDANPGEVWVLTYGGEETAHVWTDRWAGPGHAFVSDRAIVESDDPDITAGRRIWPESE